MKRHHYKPSPSIRHLIKKVVIMMSTCFNNYAHAQAVVTRSSTLTAGYEAKGGAAIYIESHNGNGSIECSDCTIYNNTAWKGGGMAIDLYNTNF